MTMQYVIARLQEGQVIDAIREFRNLYGVCLKESKDAVEAIREVLPSANVDTAYSTDRYCIFSRESYQDHTYTFADSKEAAMSEANSLVDCRDEVIVARVVARSVTTKKMQEV